MANSFFQFKQFRINQDQCAMKVSTDAVVLGAAIPEQSISHILDIGTGTGVLALMMAQKFPYANIEAVEVDGAAALQATDNFKSSPWKDRIHLVLGDFKEYHGKTHQKFDLIICNPPYYPAHLKSANAQKNLAHHQSKLDYWQLLEGVNELLSETGQLWLVLPPRMMETFNGLAAESGYLPFFLLELFDKPGAMALRTVKGFGRKKTGQLERKELCIKDSQGNYSKEYQLLLQDYMLYF
ncbi:tRNA1(Val) (adenine(37)-N6)-methyltransferase [Pleomorphovibrio marinus]|uniref:tRNA1(Val) (adenine(37)-N6)-methyltransferase n=1 Tax=Pleomorphovibrio marinus TaxID=2164132 RepID=UPI0013006659|nr:methyltransferase [Pleomorphovibrio marinus]